MKKLLPLLGIVSLLTGAVQPVFAQQKDFSDDPYYYNNYTFEVGASVGVMNCLTDLGGSKGSGKQFIKDLNLGNSEPAGSVYFSGGYRNAFLLRTEATWGVVKASDAVLKNVKESTLGRYERNLSFRSTIFEVSLVTEIHPRYFKKYAAHDKLPRLSPYLLGGIGYFAFNPRAKLNGSWVDLRPLRTEGEGFTEYPNRKIYQLKQINFPVGAGFKYKLNDEFNFSVECVYRILNTDYLDDVSTKYIDPSVFAKYFSGAQLQQALALQDRQAELNPAHTTIPNDIRGNSQKNDAYFSVNFKIGFIF